MPATAGRFYSASEKLWVLKVSLEQVENGVKWEGNESGCFPHLYGAGLGISEVEDMKMYTRGEDDDWMIILEKDEWLC